MNAAPLINDLALLVRRLARSLRQASPHHPSPDMALDFLVRHGLQGDPLRGVEIPPPAPGSEAAKTDAVIAEADRVLAEYYARNPPPQVSCWSCGRGFTMATLTGAHCPRCATWNEGDQACG